ncbi:hypothetical protein KSF78_0000735 [Schistosoma japonicum]|nr:hypothetical protein KSF78_0000735 [Schistosoma japonicum]
MHDICHMFDYFIFGLIIVYTNIVNIQTASTETTSQASITSQGWVRVTMDHDPRILNPRRLPHSLRKTVIG